ncbi:MAG: 50S ribosomal protein L4 [Bdellovibrionales bacterium RBG_16_40_8]|nr:MAG: 50S ribosomal protein L4 [Bdellovibrionales bacterium RBG_16_40_8]
MAKVDIIDWDKKKVGQVELDPNIFEQPVKKAVIHSLVKWQLASRRRGTHKAKNKSEVSGGGKKPFKQKGTGSARQGSSRSPLNVGGGVVFPPTPRDYSYTIPKKMKQVGLRSVLSHLFGSGRIIILDDMKSADGKTKELVGYLKNIGFEKAVLIDGKSDLKMTRATRNLKDYRYYSTDGLNVYDLLKYNAAIISKDSLDGIAKRCGPKISEKN